MRRSDHHESAASSEDFGAQFDDSADLTEQFWGESPTWRPREHSGQISRPRVRERSNDDTTGAIRAIRDGIDAFRPQRRDRHDPTGEVRRTRAHGVVPSGAPAGTREAPVSRAATREATIGELAAGWGDDPIPARPRRTSSAPQPDPVVRPHYSDDEPDEAALIPLASTMTGRLGLGAVDPLLARLGAIVLAGVLLVPLALSLRPSSDAGALQTTPTPLVASEESPPAESDLAAQSGRGDTASSQPVAGASTGGGAVVSADAATVQSPSDAAGQPAESEQSDASSQPASADESSSGESGDQSAAPGAITQDENPASGEAATVDATAERVVPDCSLTYTASVGDSWYRIADAAGVSPNELLNQNRATVDSLILPGDDICLPKGATVPSAPTPVTTTPASPTTDAPTTTEAPSTTAAPTTTEAPSNSTPVIVSTDEVQRLIREIWPADQHEKALQVAWRESRYHADADNNFCCYGVFQIYFTVHRSWLDDFGIYTATDLFDARKNITAAYELYQRAGGWGPWGG